MRLADEDRIDVLEFRNDILEDTLARFIETTEDFIRESREARERSEKAEREFRERMKNSDRESKEFREWMKNSDREAKSLREESEKASGEFREWMKNSDREAKSLREESEKADRELQERISKDEKEMQERISKAEKEMQERISKADRELRREINRSHGELINKLGTLAEDIVAPGLPGIARKYFDTPILNVFTVRSIRRSVSNPAREKEFDAIAVSDRYFFLTETKSNPKPEYAQAFTDSLSEIFDFFPEYSQKKLIPVFASLYIHPNVVKYLSRHGVYAMGMKDDGMDLLNFGEVSGK